MTGDELRAIQQPLKQAYQENPEKAQVTLRAVAQLDFGQVACRLPSISQGNEIIAGLHPAAGGDGSMACSAEMLLQALAACAGVTLSAVATAIGLNIMGGQAIAEGDLDFRGTLGVERGVPVGLNAIRLRFQLETEATPEQLSTLERLTERYCVVFQTLKEPPPITCQLSRGS